MTPKARLFVNDDRPAFTDDQKREISAVLGNSDQDVITSLTWIVAAARRGDYRGVHKARIMERFYVFSETCARIHGIYTSADPDTRSMLENTFGAELWLEIDEGKRRWQRPRRRPGRPKKSAELGIAVDVGVVLMNHRVRISAHREGTYARTLKTVFDASGMDAPDDLLRLMKTSRLLAREALHRYLADVG